MLFSCFSAVAVFRLTWSDAPELVQSEHTSTLPKLEFSTTSRCLGQTKDFLTPYLHDRREIYVKPTSKISENRLGSLYHASNGSPR